MFGLFEGKTKDIKPQPLLQKIADKKYKLSYKTLNQMRAQMNQKVKEEFKLSHAADKDDPRQAFINSLSLLSATRKEHFYNIDEINCNSSWPVCTFDFTYNQRFVTYFKFKVGTPLSQLYIDDYYFTGIKKEDEKQQPDDILIERNQHFCGGDGYIDKFVQSMSKDYDSTLVAYIYDKPEIKRQFFEENGAEKLNLDYKERLMDALNKIGEKKKEANLSEKVIEDFYK